MSVIISVLLPVYNAERYIKESIDSVLNQTYGQFELIVINDGSTDQSENIILSFNDSRIRYVKNETNIGLVASLNKGIHLAEGKYIARMDADDISELDRFEKQVAYLDAHPTVGLCGSQLKVLGKDTILEYPELNADIKFDFLRYNAIPHPVVMFRKALLLDHNLSYETTYYPAEDYGLWVQLSTVCDLYNFPNPLLQYRLHESSISHTQRTNQIENMALIRAAYLLRISNYWSCERENTLKKAFFGSSSSSKEELQSLVTILQECYQRIDIFEKRKLFIYIEECIFNACANTVISIPEILNIYYNSHFCLGNKRMLKLFLIKIKLMKL